MPSICFNFTAVEFALRIEVLNWFLMRKLEEKEEPKCLGTIHSYQVMLGPEPFRQDEPVETVPPNLLILTGFSKLWIMLLYYPDVCISLV